MRYTKDEPNDKKKLSNSVVLKLWEALPNAAKRERMLLSSAQQLCEHYTENLPYGTMFSKSEQLVTHGISQSDTLLLHRIITATRQAILYKESPDILIQYLSIFLSSKNRYAHFNELGTIHGLDMLLDVLRSPNLVSAYCIEQTLHILLEVIQTSKECKDYLGDRLRLKIFIHLLEWYDSTNVNFLLVKYVSNYKHDEKLFTKFLKFVNLLFKSPRALAKRAAMDLCNRLWCRSFNIVQYGETASGFRSWQIALVPQLTQALVCKPVGLQYEVRLRVR